MGSRVHRHLRSNVVGYIAVFIALSGTAYAAVKIGPKDFKKGAVTTRAIKKDAVRSKQVKDGSLKYKDVKNLKADVARFNRNFTAVTNYSLRLRQAIDSLATRVKALEDQSLQGQINGLKTQIDGLTAQIAAIPAPADLSALNDDVNSLCSQMADVTDQSNALGTQIDGVTGALVPPGPTPLAPYNCPA